MKKLLTILPVLLPLLVSAQKVQLNEIDKFTGTHTISITPELIYLHGNGEFITETLALQFVAVDKEISLTGTIGFNDVVKYKNGDGISLLFKGGKVIDLTCTRYGVGNERYMTITDDYFCPVNYFKTTFNLTREELEYISQNKLTDIRVKHADGNFDTKIRSANAKRLRKAAKLLLKAVKKAK